MNMNENIGMLMQILLKYYWLIFSKSALVHIMGWRVTGGKLLPEPMLTMMSEQAYLHSDLIMLISEVASYCY